MKNDPDALTSKGYCFVEYADPNATQVAVIGLNGMDLGGGKVLTARVAGERSGAVQGVGAPTVAAVPPGSHEVIHSQPQGIAKPDAVIVNGYDIEELVDAAMGLKPMPTAPVHVDQFGVPITRTAPILNSVMPVQPQQPQMPMPQATPPQAAAVALPPGSSALEIANAALDAAFGAGNAPPPAAPQLQQPSKATRILILLNMVSDEDLSTDDEYQGLVDEVQEECAKYGKLLGMKIPRAPSSLVEPSAVKKIFLEYATSQDAKNAERELAGRQFGPNVVQVGLAWRISMCHICFMTHR